MRVDGIRMRVDGIRMRVYNKKGSLQLDQMRLVRSDVNPDRVLIFYFTK